MSAGAGVRLEVHFGEALRSGARGTSQALMELFAATGVTVATLYRGLEGFGTNRRLQESSFPDISSDLPLLATAVGPGDRIGSLLADVGTLVDQGLLTAEPVLLLDGGDHPWVELPAGAGPGVKLTVYCGRGERVGPVRAYRAVVDQLQRQGVSGATVLFGVDGYFRGERRRAQLFGANTEVPVAVLAVASEEAARRALTPLHRLVPAAVVTAERVRILKHDGVALEPFPAEPGGEVPVGEHRMSVEVYARRSDRVNGRALHGELTRQLRRSGAAGATTITGEWGVSRDERPRGDKLWSWGSHVPTVTRSVDTDARMRGLWPVVDELTAQYGLVTSQPVGAYEERVAGQVNGTIHRPVGAPFPPAAPPAQARAVTEGAAPAGEAPRPDSEEARWVQGLVAEVGEFARRCGRSEIAVRVTLVDGEQFFLMAAGWSPGSGAVTLHPHPLTRAELVVGADGQPRPPREVIVALRSIVKVELLANVPRGIRSLAVFQPRGIPGR